MNYVHNYHSDESWPHTKLYKLYKKIITILIFYIFTEENQYELLKSNGLPLMIQALTEFKNEELNKAAIYVLHNCKKISKFTVTLGKYQLAGQGSAHLCPSPGKQGQAESPWVQGQPGPHSNSLSQANKNPKISTTRYSDTQHLISEPEAGTFLYVQSQHELHSETLFQSKRKERK